MKLKLLIILTILSGTVFTGRAQCLNGGCNVGLSREQVNEGVFIGNYEQEKRHGLGITYTYNPKGIEATYAHYLIGKKDGVTYNQLVEGDGQTITHTFENYQKGNLVYPAFQVVKKDKVVSIQVAFDDKKGWEKYEGDIIKEELQVKTILHNGSPTFLAFNGADQVMAISATVSSLKLLSSDINAKYYNPLQLEIRGESLLIDAYPKTGASETAFRSNIGWDMKNYEDGVWLYRRFFNNEVSYKYTYEDVLDLPSEQVLRQQKVQKAFDFIAEQVQEYNFDKGPQDKAKDFMNMLEDVRARAENKGFTIPSVFDITMTELHLRNGDRVKSLKYAQSACAKSDKNYAIINNLITTEFTQYSDLLDEIKTEGEVAITND